MIVFIDYNNLFVYLTSPKCGSQSIAKMLNTDLHTSYPIDEQIEVLSSDKFKKIIIYRKNIFSRFLSGFYEDLFNNNCYDKMDITFDNYLIFLNTIFLDKNKFVNKLMDDKNKEIPIWFGNCSNVSLPITDCNGYFVSHIVSQKYCLTDLINLISGNNVYICELNELNKITGDIHINKKEKNNLQNIGNMKLHKIKNDNIIIDAKALTEYQKNIINKIYEEDISFINDLETKFKKLIY